jgi:DNA-binding GntR family transcriptional regulator
MAAGSRHRPVIDPVIEPVTGPGNEPADRAELRRLIELSALRRLADRGLSDQEYLLAKKLADATARRARSGDVLGFLRADLMFHRCLLELIDDPALSDIARALLVPSQPIDTDQLLTEAHEHAELIALVADGRVSAADDLLRLHLSRRGA